VYTEGGLVYTLLEVSEGEVLVRLKTSDGTYNGVEASFTAGQSALIRGNSDFSEFVVGEENEIILILNYEILPENAVDRLIEIIKVIDDNVIVGEIEAQKPVLEEADNADIIITDNTDNGDDNTVSANESENEADTAEADSDSDNDSDTAVAAQHTHKSGDWVITEQATCAKTGIRQKTCTECGEILNTETIPMTEHKAGDWTLQRAPGCTLVGNEAQLCIYCNKVLNSRDIPMVNHTYSNGSCIYCGASDPSYSAGNGSAGSSDQSSYVSDTTPATPAAPACTHNWVEDVDPTTGSITGQHCTLCGATY